MNRRQKIIVSVTGIFLVLLILVGLTYAYFLTRINGNPNNTSISLTTANLQLDWIDGTDKIIDSTDVIIPGQFESSITFSVKNNGNATVKDYGVILTDLRIKWATTIEDTEQIQDVDTYLEYPKTMKLVVCQLENGVCNEDSIKYNSSLPTTNEILFTSNITSGETQEYKATLEYIDEGDQSADMNKTITARLDIIDTKNTAVLAGIVDNYQPGDIVQSNSTPRISTIDKNGNYKIVGLEPGNHTVSVKNKSNDSQGSKAITVEKDTKIIELNVDRSTIEYKLNGSVSNPYSEGTLAYGIINNAQNKKNGTHLVVTPPSKVAEEISTFTSYKTIGEETTFTDTMSSGNSASQTWYYYDTYTVDTKTGKFTLSGKHSCTYNSTTTNTDGETVNCYDDMINKYLKSSFHYDNTTESKTSLSKVYKVTEATSTTFSYVIIFNSPNETERVLAPTTDDYGISYYFRGGVIDNYVNFAGMCWKIVHIAGDGSTKLILEDQYATCDDTEKNLTSAVYTGNWNIGKGNYGHSSGKMNYLNPVSSPQASMVKAFYDFQTTKLANYTDKLKSGDWCLADKAYTQSGSSPNYTYTLLEEYNYSSSMYYDAYTRLSKNANGYQPTLKCTGTIMDNFKSVTYNGTEIIEESPMYVSAITADEIVYAGGKYGTVNYNYYLLNVYQKSNEILFSSLSPYYFDNFRDKQFGVSSNGSLDINGQVDSNYYSFRPAVSLNKNVKIIRGDGTLKNPYVIAE